MTGLKEYLFDKMKKGTIHLTLLDPDPAKLTDESAREISAKLKEAGTDAFMLGGSTGVTSESLRDAAIAVKESAGLPTIYFPSSHKALTSEVDGIFFMTVINAGDPLFITHGHAMASAYIKLAGLETISMAYIIVEPGMTVGRITKAKLVGHDDIEAAIGYALAAEMFGMELIYLEAGSGADRPVSPEMITAVKEAVNIPVIVGGGIRTPEAAKAAREAGANAIVTGTFVEQCSDSELLTAVVHAAKGI